MPAAIDPQLMPSKLRAYAGLLARRRPGLAEAAQMPRLERCARGVRLDTGWLAAYRTCVGLVGDRADGALPPLALQMAAAPLHLDLLADASFPFKAWGLVHVAQRLVQHAPIAAGLAVDLRTFTARAWRGRRGMNFELVTEAHADGHLLWRGQTTALARGGQGAASEPTGDPAASDEEPALAGPPAETAADAVPWRAVATLVLPEALGRRYAAIAGDLNPIHQHALLARPFGYRRAIVHGTWTLARALAAAGLPQGASYVVDARFRKPVLLPSTIMVWVDEGATVQRVKVTDPEGERVHLELQITPAEN